MAFINSTPSSAGAVGVLVGIFLLLAFAIFFYDRHRENIKLYKHEKLCNDRHPKALELCEELGQNNSGVENITGTSSLDKIVTFLIISPLLVEYFWSQGLLLLLSSL